MALQPLTHHCIFKTGPQFILLQVMHDTMAPKQYSCDMAVLCVHG